MNVSQLMDILSEFDPNDQVKIIYDGEPRMDVNVIFKSNSGYVMITDIGETVYSKESSPLDNIVCAPEYAKYMSSDSILDIRQ